MVKTNGLCVNPGKTQKIKFGSNFSIGYFVFGTSVQFTNVCKYLGIFLMRNLLSNFTLNMCAKNSPNFVALSGKLGMFFLNSRCFASTKHM